MAGQMLHLLNAGTRPRVVVQVLPFSAGMHPMLGGGVTLMTLKDGETIAQVESFASEEGVSSARRVVDLTERFDLARSMALTRDESLDLIRVYLGEYEDERDS